MAERYHPCSACGTACRGTICRACYRLTNRGPQHPNWKGNERLTRREVYERHAEHARAYGRAYYQANREHLLPQARQRALDRYRNNPPGRTYSSWTSMLARCSNPKSSSWKNYGGRGITVCERWYDFANFLADMGERPDGKTLDRRDNDGPYKPANCRWATPKEQAANRRRPR